MDINLKNFLDLKVDQFNRLDFINHDPISIPHQFDKKQDIEIAGFFAAMFSWGLRKTIINKSNDLIKRMDADPFRFILHHSSRDLKNIIDFKHRTFNSSDALGMIASLKRIYTSYSSLEDCFLEGYNRNSRVADGINFVHETIFQDEDILNRTKKHFPCPDRGSACKRFNMFLRWMVRKDDKGVDFGLWEGVAQSELIIPLDVHVIRIARKLKLLDSDKSNWKNAVELTQRLSSFDPSDPVKYDYALFGMGTEKL